MPAAVFEKGLDTMKDAGLRPSAVTVGNFDGVHRGHRALLDETVRVAREKGISAVVVTFDPHPAKVLAPERAPRRLVPLERRLELLAESGVDGVVVQAFDEAFSKLTPQAFVDRVLVSGLGTKVVVVGPGFGFGAGRAGTVEVLEDLGKPHGIEVLRVTPVLEGGAPISSTRIRAVLAKGDVEQAARLLGRPAELQGRVIPGSGRGRQLGIPTANLELETEAVPMDGVYAGSVDVEERTHLSVVNLGVRPTLQAGRAAEVHLLDFDGSLYGRTLVVRLERRLRDEQRFPSVGALREQIERDIESARHGAGR